MGVGVTWRVVGFEDSITSNKSGHKLLPFKLKMVGCVISCLFGGGGKVCSVLSLSHFPLLTQFLFIYLVLFIAWRSICFCYSYCTDFYFTVYLYFIFRRATPLKMLGEHLSQFPISRARGDGGSLGYTSPGYYYLGAALQAVRRRNVSERLLKGVSRVLFIYYYYCSFILML